MYLLPQLHYESFCCFNTRYCQLHRSCYAEDSLYGCLRAAAEVLKYIMSLVLFHYSCDEFSTKPEIETGHGSVARILFWRGGGGGGRTK